jgi:hypothetical protein
MDKFFDLLGLGTPFLYGAGTYAFFHRLDGNASDEAKAAFARLIEVKRYDSNVISAAIVRSVGAHYYNCRRGIPI